MQRRDLITAAGALAALSISAPAAPRKGRLKQAVTRGVFGRGNKMSMDDMVKKAAEMGVAGFDLVGPEDFPILKKYGLAPRRRSAFALARG